MGSGSVFASFNIRAVILSRLDDGEKESLLMASAISTYVMLLNLKMGGAQVYLKSDIVASLVICD